MITETEKPLISLGLSYLNNEKEIPRSLDLWLKSGLIDIVIAIDGRYKVPLSPKMMSNGVPPKFSTDNSELVLEGLLERYPDIGLYKDKVYGTEVEKRQKIMDVSAELRTDILIVWDTDEIIRIDYNNPELFFNNLMRFYKPDVPEVYGMYMWLPSKELWARQFNVNEQNIWYKYARIHTNPGEQRYMMNHYTFTTKQYTDAQIMAISKMQLNEYFYCPEIHPFILYQMIGIDGIRFTTDRILRNQNQLDFGHAYGYQHKCEERYRMYVLDMKIGGYTEDNINPNPVKDRPRNVLERKFGTYYFDEENGFLIPYNEAELELYNSLDK